MTKYYQNSTLYPSLSVIVLSIVYSIVDSQEYKSAWDAQETFVSIIFLLSLLYAIIYSLACLPIFLVQINVIRRNKIFTALSWFLLPISLITFLAIKQKWDIYFYIMSAPFVVGLCWTYVCYRRNIYAHNLKSIVKDDGA